MAEAAKFFEETSEPANFFEKKSQIENFVAKHNEESTPVVLVTVNPCFCFSSVSFIQISSSHFGPKTFRPNMGYSRKYPHSPYGKHFFVQGGYFEEGFCPRGIRGGTSVFEIVCPGGVCLL
jgi:hypothetical protein